MTQHRNVETESFQNNLNRKFAHSSTLNLKGFLKLSETLFPVGLVSCRDIEVDRTKSLSNASPKLKSSTWILQVKTLCVVLSCRARLLNSTTFISIIKIHRWSFKCLFLYASQWVPITWWQRKCFAFRMWVNLQPLPISVIIFSSKETLFSV